MNRCAVLCFGLLVFSIAGATVPCRAARATASAGATIAPGLAVTSVKGLEFGVISPEAAGSVVVSPDGERTASSGLTLLDAGATEFAAEFRVTGAPGASYSVRLPTSVLITCGGESMTVSEFVASPPVSLVDGSGTLRVGATLSVGLNQPAGRYGGWFEVTVDYD